jgi:electron transport complex protein RnfC
LPTEVGVLVLDAPAAIAIGSFVLSDRPAINTFVAVRVGMTRQVKRAVAPTGTDFGTILKSLGFPTSNVTVRAGELLRDRRVSLNGTIGEGELSLHVAPTEPVINPDPCVRCGWCVEICPTRVQPAVILDAAQRHDNDMADRGGLSACIECGHCTYICPSKLPLLATIRQLKQVI